MAAWTLVGGVLLSMAVSLAFIFVGRRSWRRARGATYARPIQALGLFWYALAAAALADGALTALALADPGVLWPIHVVMQLRIVTTLAALGGLAYHLLFIYRGKGYVVPILVAYVGLMVLIEWTAWRLRLVGVAADPWRGWYDWAVPANTPEYFLSITFLWVPPVLLGILYVRLARSNTEPDGRFRGQFMGAAIAGYFAATYIGFLEFHNAWWGLAQHLLGLMMAILAVWAMEPPAWARARFGARSSVHPRRRTLDQTLDQRIAMLV